MLHLVADVGAKKRVDSYVLICKLIFGHKSYIFVQILSPRFGQDFEVEVSARF